MSTAKERTQATYRCEHCVWWQVSENTVIGKPAQWGFCHTNRLPGSSDSTDWMWPMCRADDFCCHFQKYNEETIASPFPSYQK